MNPTDPHDHALFTTLRQHPLLRFDTETTEEGHLAVVLFDGTRLSLREGVVWAQRAPRRRGASEAFPLASDKLDSWLTHRLTQQLERDRGGRNQALRLQEIRAVFPDWDWRSGQKQQGEPWSLALTGVRGELTLEIELHPPACVIGNVALWLGSQRLCHRDWFYDLSDDADEALPVELADAVHAILTEGGALAALLRSLSIDRALELLLAWAPPSAEEARRAVRAIPL